MDWSFIYGQSKKIKIMDKYLKWVATLFLMIGVGANSLAIYPAGPLFTLAGGLTWLIVSIMWKEAALITTNIVLSVEELTSLCGVV
jgi:hypothetical protein